MAQGSVPWDDGIGGDAAAGSTTWDSPYSSAEWRSIWSTLFNSDNTPGLVMPGYLLNLRVHERAVPDMNVEIDTGRLFVKGGLYTNTATATLAIAASDPVNPRIDRIVAQLHVANQQIRLVVVAGVAAANPALTALTQTAAIWEVDLAHVYVRGNTLSILDEDIDDKRTFAPTGLQAPSMMGYNLLANSEFMAFSSLSIASPAAYPPDYWRLVISPTYASATKLGQMSRGRCCRVTTDAANEGLYQTVLVKPSTMYAIRGCYQVTAGDVGKVNITTNSGAPVGLTRELRRVGTNLEFIAYYITEADATTLTLQLLGLNAGDIIDFGQFIIAEGYEAGPFREIRETLPFEYAEIRDPGYDGDNVAQATYQLDLDANWGGLILVGTRAINVLMGYNSAPVANGAQLNLRNVTTDRVLGFTGWQGGGGLYGWLSSFWIAPDVNRQIEVVVSTANWNPAWFVITGIMI